MAKKKASSNTTTGAGGQKYRKETKEERKVRLQQQAEAREACFKLLPIIGGIVVAMLVAFGLYVNSIPPHVPAQPVTPATPDNFMAFQPNQPKQDAANAEPDIAVDGEAKPEEKESTEGAKEETIEL